MIYLIKCIKTLKSSIKFLSIKFYFKKIHDLRNYIMKKYIIKKFSSKKEIKLHLGCGEVYLEGWINLDNNSDKNIKKLDVHWDLRNGIPFEDNSINFIYNEHFLEHLTVEESEQLLKECKRVLKPNGVIRISMPDLEQSVKDYLNPNWKKDNEKFFTKFGLNFIKTRAELINISFRWWGHQWFYDKEELERRLYEAGFNNIKFCKIHKSSYPELNNLETRNESILVAEAIKN